MDYSIFKALTILLGIFAIVVAIYIVYFWILVIITQKYPFLDFFNFGIQMSNIFIFSIVASICLIFGVTKGNIELVAAGLTYYLWVIFSMLAYVIDASKLYLLSEEDNIYFIILVVISLFFEIFGFIYIFLEECIDKECDEDDEENAG